MKSTIRYFSLLVIVVFVNFAQGQTITKDLPNFYPINANLFRGAQPTEAGVKQLADMGVKTIIELRGADEKAETEESWARAAKINFINIPLNNWFGPKDEKIEKVLVEINKTENQPVFVHCQRGADRTGTVIAVYRITHDGWTAKQANDEAKKFGFGWWQFWMKDYINDYYRDFKSSKK
jgi:protein tyrosine/serine phosphatase